MEMKFAVITTSVWNPLGSLFQFATRMEALRFMRRLGDDEHAQLLDLA